MTTTDDDKALQFDAIRSLRIGPTDTLVLRTAGVMTSEQFERIRNEAEKLRALVGAGHIVVLPPGFGLDVMRRDGDGADAPDLADAGGDAGGGGD